MNKKLALPDPGGLVVYADRRGARDFGLRAISSVPGRSMSQARALDAARGAIVNVPPARSKTRVSLNGYDSRSLASVPDTGSPWKGILILGVLAWLAMKL